MSRWFPRIRSRRWLFLPPLALGIVVVGWLASSRKELNRVDVSETAKPLQVVRVHQQNVQAEAIGFGTVKPRRLWSAVAEVGGRVVAAAPNLRSGVAVKRGDLLVSIDPTDYQLRSDQRAAELAQAKAQLDQMRLTEQNDLRSLEIQQDLLGVRQSESDRLVQLQRQSAASQSESDTARAALLQQKQTVQTLKNTLTTYPAQIAAAQAAVDLAQARLTEAERDVERSNIVAPFDGLLSGVTLETDQYVSPQQQLFEIYDTKSVEIESQFSIAQFQRILHPQGMSSSLPGSGFDSDSVTKPAGHSDRSPISQSMADQYAQSGPGDTFDVRDFAATITARSGDVSLQYTGQAVRMTEALNEQTRTLGIVIGVNNREGTQGGLAGALRPGTYCEVVLHSTQTAPAHLVPRTSVTDGSVYIVDDDDRLRRRPVQIAFPLREQFAISDGLNDGDRVVVFPPTVAIEGELIQPQSSDQANRQGPPKTPETVEARGPAPVDRLIAAPETRQ